MKRTISIIIKGIIITLSLVLFMWYLLPIVYARVINFGNIVGLLITTFVIAVALFFENIVKSIKSFWRKTLGKFILSFISVCLAVCIVFSGFIVFSMMHYAKKEFHSNSTVIVLGCQVRGDTPSAMLYERIKAAYNVLSKNSQAVCIASGGQGNNENISEAQCIYNELVKMGISPDRIYIEDKSVNTQENIAFSYKIIKENNLSKDITIVTDGFHQYRAYLLAKNYDFDYIGASSSDTLDYMKLTYYTREIFAVAKELIL